MISNWKLNIKKITDIKPQAFSPKPKVDSSLLVFFPKKKFVKIKKPENLEKITHVLFSNKRKMINKAISKLFKNPKILSQKLNIDVFEGPTLSSNNDNIIVPSNESFKFIKTEKNFTRIDKDQFSNSNTFLILLSFPILSL